MRTDIRNSGTHEIDACELSPTTVFELLANDRRRYAFHYLATTVGATSLDDLADQIALWERTATADQHRDIRGDLHHRHLPLLADTGVVRYDPDRETVELRDCGDDLLAPFLKLVVGDDLQ
ncbi:DUF7344 domain-containing protein [Halorussus amylolyticus]|uniref:DUF7344 domain-containing protein n=1 Tax=Halorussus amylolyticus TaxID=1126242 RepID=UPI001047C9C9|nr:hypothetical protein [Halorussus amylolyticus]